MKKNFFFFSQPLFTMTHDKANKSRGRSSVQDPNKTDKAGRTKIFSSTSSGSLDKVKELIERGADVNHRDNAGWAPLHEAALKGQYEVAQLLIKSGAIVNVRGFEDDTPLHDACSFGYADCVKLLVDHGADVYALNTDKKRPIDLCEDKACIKIVKAKMKELDRLASRDNHGKTSLHRACIEGSIEVVLDLLNTGADTNATDTSQWTPLHCAAQHGHLKIVKLLIERGADMNSLGNGDLTVLHVACQNGREKIVQFLVDSGVNVHVVDKNGQTPYQVADSPAVRQIITAHIDEERRLRATTEAIDEITFVSNTKQKRRTAEVTATSTPNEDDTLLSREERKIQAIMKAFEKAEKKQQAKRLKKDEEGVVNNTKKRKSPSRQRQESRECSVDNNNNTVTATKKSNIIVDTSKFDPFKKDTSGRTYLHRWSIRGNTQVVKDLLKAGANPGERDNAGYTPLHEAALRGKTEVVRLLLENNADVNCKGADLDTPLHDATENSFPNVVQLLLEHGADVTVKNSKGQTPLQIAEEEENEEIATILRNHKEIRPKKRKLVLAADLEPCKQPESPTSPIGGFDMTAKAHARQLSGQHLPKKSLKPHLVKTEVPPDGPHTPIPTPPPERWQQKFVKKEDDDIRLLNNNTTEVLYPSIHCASRFLPLYTIQLLDGHSNQFFVVDLQVSLLLGITTHQLSKQYPHLHRRQVQNKEKERLWSPLSTMICNHHEKEAEKKKFLNTDIYFVRLDQVVSMIKDDYSHLSESLITITLDIGYTPSSTVSDMTPPQPLSTSKSSVKLPPKFAMKMRKCGMLSFDQKNKT
ncbi:unnamed protein product [Mucor hiemalis]